MSRRVNIEQGSQEWVNWRSTKITGSTLKDVYSEYTIKKADLQEKLIDLGINYKSSNTIAELKNLLPNDIRTEIDNRIPKKKFFWDIVAARITRKPTDESDPMTRGQELEDEALDLYEKKYKCKIIKKPCYESEEFEEVGLSADGTVEKDGKPIIGIEVKCFESGKHFQICEENMLPDEVMMQVAMYFIVCPTMIQVDVFCYDPRFLDEELQSKKITVLRSSIEEKIALYKSFMSKAEDVAKGLTAPFKEDF